jgi:protein-disulfide isomerase
MNRLAVLLLLMSAGCSAQSTPPSAQAVSTPAQSVSSPGQKVSPDVTANIQRQVQAQYDLPAEVQIDVGPRRPSDFPTYDTVTVTLSAHGKDQKLDFLLSQDGKTLARVTKIDLTKDIYAERMNKIDVKGRPIRGNPNAKVTVVNYDDLQCPFCSRMHSTLMQEILPQYGDRIKIVYKDFPLSMHPWAQHSANDANCLAAENGTAFWEYADYVHANQKAISAGQDIQKSTAELDRIALDTGKKNGADIVRLQACLKSQPDTALKASMAEGESLGLNATPTMFINGQKLEGAVDAEEVKAVLNQQLLAAGIQPPAPTPAAQPKAAN